MRWVPVRFFVTLFCFTALPALVSAQGELDLFGDGDQLPPQILERLEQKRTQAKAQAEKQKESAKKEAEGEKDSKEDAGQKVLDAFFEEIEELVSGTDKRTKTIKLMLEEYEQEYRDLELQLSDAPHDLALLDRQLIVVQYHQNLSTRTLGRDSNRMHEILNAVSDRIRKFRKEHPDLSRRADFRERERAVRNRAMQGNRFGHRASNAPSMKQTMQTLSASGKVVDRWKPQRLRAHPGEQEGAIQSAHFTMRRMLRLKWDGDRLTLDRTHWDKAFAKQTPQDIQADVNHLLEKRGVEPFANDNERQQWMRMAQRGLPVANGSPLANLGRLFQEFYTNGGRSYSGGGTSGRWTAQSNDALVRVDADLAKFTLSFEELSFPGRAVRLHTVGPNLQITVLGDFVYRFQQQIAPDGTSTVHVTELLDDEVINHKMESFAELYKQQPRYVEDRFFPLLEHLGVVPPNSRFDELISTRVIELLTGDREAIRAEFEVIAANLDVDQFTKREAAYRKLREGLDKYFPFLYEKSKSESISRETKARITKLLEIGSQKGTAELDATIAALGLTSDENYLTELKDVVSADSQAVISAQLQLLQSR